MFLHLEVPMRRCLSFHPGLKVVIGYRARGCLFLLLEKGLRHASLRLEELSLVEGEILVPVLHRVVYWSRDSPVDLRLQLGEIAVLLFVLLAKVGL